LRATAVDREFSPGIYEASVDARKSTALAASSGVPKRLTGIAAINDLLISSTVAFGRPSLSNSGVAITPGLMALTRMLRGRSSLTRIRVSDRNAALLADTAEVPAIPTSTK
jgi:hypothetical protein